MCNRPSLPEGKRGGCPGCRGVGFRGVGFKGVGLGLERFSRMCLVLFFAAPLLPWQRGLKAEFSRRTLGFRVFGLGALGI